MTRETPLQILCSEAERLNPAIILADELMRRDSADLLSTEDIERAETVLQYSAKEIEIVEQHIAAFVTSPATPSVYIPAGF
jgi:hypothetical protein